MALLNGTRAAAAAVLALLGGGCEFVRPPTGVPDDREQLLVHAVLVAGTDSASVFLARMEPTNGYVPVHGARVRVLGEGHATELRELPAGATRCGTGGPPPGVPDAPGTGCYAAPVPGGIRAGAEYRLEVEGPAGERVRGRTVVPLPPVVHAPAEGLRVRARADDWHRAAEELTVRWTAPRPAGLAAWAERAWVPGVEGAACEAYARRGFDPTQERVEMRMDSVRVRMEVWGCRVGQQQPELRPDSVEVSLGVTTYDSAYTAYVRDAENGIPLPDASAGLEGAYGVFGSASVSRRRMMYVTR